MQFVDFSAELKRVAAALDKPIKDHTVDEYWKSFEWITSEQWSEVCAWARNTCEHFPKIANINQYITGRNWSNPNVKSDLIEMSCECGEVFTVRRSQLDNANKKVKCPKNTYDMCNKSYSSRYIMDRANGSNYIEKL